MPEDDFQSATDEASSEELTNLAIWYATVAFKVAH